jgi:hypothetical protein
MRVNTYGFDPKPTRNVAPAAATGRRPTKFNPSTISSQDKTPS